MFGLRQPAWTCGYRPQTRCPKLVSRPDVHPFTPGLACLDVGK